MAQDRPVLRVAKGDEDETVMSTTRLRPATRDRYEVPQIVRDHDPLLRGRERKHVLVGEPRERLVPVEREDVVPGPFEVPSDVSVRDVRIQQDAHALLVVSKREPREGVELSELGEWPAIVGDLLVDLFRVTRVIRLRELDGASGHVFVIVDQRLD